MANKPKKVYRDRFGRFAKRGQPLKPPQPRINGKFAPRPAPLRLGVNKQGKRYWIKPRPKKEKVERLRETPIQRPTIDVEHEVEEGKKTPPTYGYDAEDFEDITDHPNGYSYVLYHIFYSPSGSPRNGPQGTYITIRGSMYNTPQDVIDNWAEEADDVARAEEANGREDLSYVRTIVAVIPASGDERVGGAVYPRDYRPVERPGTREFEIEEGKRRLREFGPPLK